MTVPLATRVIVLTGASSGIGAAVCKRLAAPNTAMVLHTRENIDGANTVAAAARAAGATTRIESKAREIQTRLRIGNTYVNRSMIGATVGVQPFGGEGWSGTAPKAGGPRYLQRMAVERVPTINTAATGGNASLASLGD